MSDRCTFASNTNSLSEDTIAILNKSVGIKNRLNGGFIPRFWESFFIESLERFRDFLNKFFSGVTLWTYDNFGKWVSIHFGNLSSFLRSSLSILLPIIVKAFTLRDQWLRMQTTSCMHSVLPWWYKARDRTLTTYYSIQFLR